MILVADATGDNLSTRKLHTDIGNCTVGKTPSFIRMISDRSRLDRPISAINGSPRSLKLIGDGLAAIARSSYRNNLMKPESVHRSCTRCRQKGTFALASNSLKTQVNDVNGLTG